MYKNARDLAVFALFIGMLLAPFFSYLAGQRAQPFEERALNPIPRLDFSRILDPGYYDELDSGLRDANPLRETAVKMNARFSYSLFGDVDSSQVVQGKNGWLFFRDTIYEDCKNKEEVQAQVENLEVLGGALTAADKPFLLTITADKAAIFEDQLTRSALELSECRIQNRSNLRVALEQSDLSYFDSWEAMKVLRSQGGIPVYIKDETHWTQFGSAEFIKEVVRMFVPELMSEEIKLVGEEVITPDLGRMTGLYVPRNVPIVRFERDGTQSRDSIIVEHEGPGRPFVINRAVSKGAPMSSMRVFVLHDSFMYVAWDQLSQFFSDAIYVHWEAITPERFAEIAQAADLVIIQSVERESLDRLGQHFADSAFADAFMAQASRDMGQIDLIWPRDSE